MANWPPLVVNRTGGGGWMDTTSLTTPLSSVETPTLTGSRETREPLMWRVNGKAISWGNYKFYWSQVWDTLRVCKEATFMWSIWHKVVAVSEWKAHGFAPTSIFKQCPFCLPNTSESIKLKIWHCSQTRRARRSVTIIMHELCGG